MRPHPLAYLALLVLPLATRDPAGQDGVGQDGVEPGPPLGLRALEKARLEALASLSEEVLGAWTLRDFVHVERPDDREKIQGFLILADGYMSMTVHALDNDDAWGFGTADLLIQSNVSRWTIDQDGQLLAVTVMGHGTSEGELERERSGSLREYGVNLVDENTLVLTRSDGTQFVFARAKSGEFSDELLQRFSNQRSGRALHFYDEE